MNIHFRNLFESLKVSCRIADKTKTWDDWGDRNFTGDYSKFYFFISGSGEITVEGKTYEPKPGQMMLIPSGVRHSFRTVPGDTYLKYWCHFDCLLNDKNLFTFLKAPYIADIKHPDALGEVFTELMEATGSEDISSVLRVKESLLKILRIYLGSCRYSFSFPFEETDMVMKILNYIDRNISKKISVAELSEIAHFHPNHFMRYFKEHTGKSPLKYIKDIRIQKAKQLLYFSSKNISETAEEIGYPDVEYFSKTFKQHTGFSPSDYRRLARSNPAISGL